MVGPILVGWVVLMLSVSGLCAQEKFTVFLDAEIGAERFTASDMHSIFPVGASLKVGPVFAFGDQWRLRLRPHAGVPFFSNKIDEWIMETLMIVKRGGQVSYAMFFLGAVTCFPSLSASLYW